MIELNANFSKMVLPQKLQNIDIGLSEIDARNKVKTFVKDRIRTNLFVATWSTQYNYSIKKAKHMWEYDLYITYDLIKFMISIIDNIDVRLWDYVTYHSYHYDENGEDPSIERGLQPNGEFILEFRHKNNLVLSKGNYELSNLLIFVYNNYECMLSFGYVNKSESDNYISISENMTTINKAYQILKEISDDRFNILSNL